MNLYDDTGRIGRVDFYFDQWSLVVEIYGYEVHSGRHAWQRDIDKENRFTLTGLRTLRFTWLQLTREAQQVAIQVAHILGHPVLWDNDPL